MSERGDNHLDPPDLPDDAAKERDVQAAIDTGTLCVHEALPKLRAGLANHHLYMRGEGHQDEEHHGCEDLSRALQLLEDRYGREPEPIPHTGQFKIKKRVRTPHERIDKALKDAAVAAAELTVKPENVVVEDKEND